MTDHTPALTLDEDTSSALSLGDRLDTLIYLVREANDLSGTSVSNSLSLTRRADNDTTKPPGHNITQPLPISHHGPTKLSPTSTTPPTDAEMRRCRPASNDLEPTASTYTPVQGDMQATYHTSREWQMQLQAAYNEGTRQGYAMGSQEGFKRGFDRGRGMGFAEGRRMQLGNGNIRY